MQRLISQDDVLILDGGNYIKGIQNALDITFTMAGKTLDILLYCRLSV